MAVKRFVCLRAFSFLSLYPCPLSPHTPHSPPIPAHTLPIPPTHLPSPLTLSPALRQLAVPYVAATTGATATALALNLVVAKVSLQSLAARHADMY